MAAQVDSRPTLSSTSSFVPQYQLGYQKSIFEGLTIPLRLLFPKRTRPSRGVQLWHVFQSTYPLQLGPKLVEQRLHLVDATEQGKCRTQTIEALRGPVSDRVLVRGTDRFEQA